jgi:putative ribosome biogenesis GTPase RsgA
MSDEGISLFVHNIEYYDLTSDFWSHLVRRMKNIEDCDMKRHRFSILTNISTQESELKKCHQNIKIHRAKVVLAGSSGVGKTPILHRLVSNTFHEVVRH